MNTYDFVHLTLAAMGGEIQGRTKLQKTVYFLGVITDSLDGLGYRPHFYGPYSFEVADAIDQLKSLGFVDQNVATAGSAAESGPGVTGEERRSQSTSNPQPTVDRPRTAATKN